MKTLTVKLIFTLIVFQAYTLQAQELTKKKKTLGSTTEEYFVLKDDKATKQGQSLTTFKDALGNKYVVEFGQYDKSLKAGTWLSFYYLEPRNFLKSSGNYVEGKKEGHWAYYYMGSTSKVSEMFGSEKRTNIIQPKKGSGNLQIEIDSSGQQLTSFGQYLNDHKAGVWEYFSYSGHLLHKFDHTANKLVLNNLREHNNDFVTFLGGPERFQNLYYTGQQEIKMSSPITKTSEAIFEVDKNGNYVFVEGYGDEAYKDHVSIILNTLPKEWIFLDINSQKKLQIITKVVYKENSFSRYSFFLDTKVIN